MKFSVSVMAVDDDTTIPGGDNDIDSSSSVGLMTHVGRKVSFLLLYILFINDYPLIPILFFNTTPFIHLESSSLGYIFWNGDNTKGQYRT